MKTKLDKLNVLYPTPTTLVGALVNGKPNFLTIAHIGIVNHGQPQLISISLGKVHYTNQGIRENKAFSVNLPSENLVAETDYCGIVSGKTTDKSSIFEVFYGELDQAPLIAACPLNMACRLKDLYDTPTHEVFIGEIVETYADASVLKDGKVDLAAVRPLLFDMSSLQYWSIGAPLAGCWQVGKALKKKGTPAE